MEVVTDPSRFPRLPMGTAVTIGAYDGVHLGHRALISGLQKLAHERGLASVVVTFDKHPAMVVRPESAPKLLTDLDQKLELLASTGIDYTVVLHFDSERSSEPAEEFVDEVLVGALDTRVVSVGEDFHFGKGRRGNVAMLEEMGRFDVAPIELVSIPGNAGAGAATSSLGAVSSTRIRNLLAEGDVDAAGRLLGRPHQVRGIVQTGDKRGRELGFPTANLAVPGEIQLPADGIYAGWYTVGSTGHAHPAAISLGRRPTFYEDADASLLEAHLLDFDGDLYGDHGKVAFVARLRGEVKFESVDALVAQIAKDVKATRTALT